MRFVGVDTGGTFTDFVYFDGKALTIHKVLSTPDAPERAILAGIQALGIKPDALQLVHGSTVATNALLEGKIATTAYITNRGLADVLTIGRQARNDIYALTPVAPKPPVPSQLCFEVDTRLSAQGETLAELTTKDITVLLDQLSQHRIDAVAINLLFSFLDGSQERLIADALPDHLFVSCSHEVLPEYGEYERGIATWINAGLGPVMYRYLNKLCESLPHAFINVMQSSAGTVSATEAGRLAVHLLLSGPAAGLIGAKSVAAITGREQLLSFDMGGTSTDVALVDGDIRLTRESRIGRYPVAVPMVDMHTIGAGGGSIARVDEGGILQVGPESAGASPGPACYGLGGQEATVTDAHVVLGRLPSVSILAGGMCLHRDAACAVMDKLVAKLKLSREETASGIIRIANEHMARALRVISVQRGIAVGDFTLLSFGGAGGLHVCALAELMGMTRAMVPVHSGVLSALGMLMAPRQRVLTHTAVTPLRTVSEAVVEARLMELADQGRQKMRAEGLTEHDIAQQFSLDIRYSGQSYTLEVPWTQSVQQAEDDFHRAHKQQYGHDLSLPVELVNLRVKLHRPPPPVTLPEFKMDKPARMEPVRVYGYDGSVPCVTRQSMDSNTALTGPVIILDSIATTFVEKNWIVKIDHYGNLLLCKN